jgi:tetratricopeptide (TPR) repeat protein
MNNEQENSNDTYYPPSSGRVLGILVSKLGLRGPKTAENTARRYFRGKGVSPESEAEIHRELAELLVKSGLLPVLPPIEELNINWSEIVVGMISAHCEMWDQLVAFVWRTSAPIKSGEQAVECYMKLVITDVAFRIGAAIQLLGLDPPSEEVPDWAMESARGVRLKEILSEIGPKRPPLDELAYQAEVSESILDDWLAGTVRPGDDNLIRIATTLANYHPGANADELAIRLRRHYFFTDLCSVIAGQIGYQRVGELAMAMVTFSSRFVGLNSPRTDSIQLNKDLIRIVVGGSRTAAVELVRSLAKQESDPAWREALLASAMNNGWEAYVQDNAFRIAAEIGNPLPLPGDAGAPPDHRDYEHQFIERATATREALALGNEALARQLASEDIADLRGRIRNHPESVEYHYSLGRRLSFYGLEIGDPEMIAEGILEFRLTSQLDPDWDIPPIEVGITKMKQRLFEEARLELEAAMQRFDPPSATLKYNLAQTRMLCKDFTGAIPLFEDVVEEVPTFAAALDELAWCYKQTGRRRDALTFANRARRLGQQHTYETLQGDKN